jgi:hypothetical protein
LLLFHFVFASIHFCFASDAKTSKKHFFRIEAIQISLLFRFNSLRSENDGSFRFFFVFFASFHFRSASDFYISHRCESSEKSIEAKKQKKFRFRFALFRFEAKMTAHPTSNLMGAGVTGFTPLP